MFFLLSIGICVLNRNQFLLREIFYPLQPFTKHIIDIKISKKKKSDKVEFNIQIVILFRRLYNVASVQE